MRAGVALSVLGVVVAWALAMAGAAAEAVATQRSRFGTGPAGGLYPPSDADLGVALDKLLPLLRGRGGALDQVLAFQEVCTLAERGGVRGRSWLKQCVLGGGGGAEAVELRWRCTAVCTVRLVINNNIHFSSALNAAHTRHQHIVIKKDVPSE